MGKKVIITGVNGFIGSHLAGKCLQSGYDVLGIDLAEKSKVAGIAYSQMDLSRDSIESILKKERAYALLHCAGMAAVKDSVERPEDDFVSNVLVSRKVLYALKDFSRETALLFLSSAGVYGNPAKNPIEESHEKRPISPYALHKSLIEEMCSFFVRQYGMDIRILRIFSAYGAGLRKQIFWDMGQKVQRDGKLELYGTGAETRDFIYIDDLTNAIRLIMEAEKVEHAVYNVANGVEISIRNIAGIFCKECGLPEGVVSFNQYKRTGDPVNWCADIARLRQLGYRMEIDIRAGVAKYVEWLKQTGVI